MVRRSLRIAFDVIGALLAGFLLLVGFTAWRLSNGHPFHLAFLVPLVEQALAAPDGSFQVRMDDIVVAWTGGEQLVGLRAVHVRAVAADGRELASVPQIGLKLSVSALSRGMLAPTEVEIFEPRIHMRRSVDGHFQFLATVEGAAAGQPSAIVPELLQELLGRPDPRLSTGYLRRVHMIGGSLAFDDKKTGLVWHAPKLDIDLRRDRQGIDGRLLAQISEFGDPAVFDGDFSFDSATRIVTLNSHYQGLDIASLGLIVPDLTLLSGSHLQFQGSFNSWVDLEGHFGPMRFTVQSGPGSLDLQDHYVEPLPVTSLAAAGELKAGLDELRLDSFRLDLGGPLVSASADVTGVVSDHVPKMGKLRIAGHATATDIPVESLPRLWPVNLGGADNARSWVVENIDQGIVHQVNVDFDVGFAGGNLDMATVTAFGGTLKASGIGLHYFRPLPPIRGAEGNATFDANKFEADFASGGVGKIGIRRGHLAITGLETDTQIVNVEGDVAGPFSDALRLLDNPRLGYASKLGINPAATDGSVATHLSFRFPAVNHMRPGDLHMAASARITNASIGGIVLHRDLTDGNVDLKLDDDGMTVAGQVKLAGVPAALQWASNFVGRDPKTSIQIASDATADDLANLGFDYRSVLKGPVRVDLRYDEFENGSGSILADLGLTQSSVDIDFADWHKPPGEPGQATMTVDLLGDKPTAIRSFSFSAGDFSGEGQAEFGPNGKLARATFARVTMGETRLQQVAIDLAGPKLDIHVAGGEFDAQRFLEKSKPGAGQANTAGSAPPPEKPTQPFRITADRLTRVLLGPGRQIGAVRLIFDYDGLHWQAVDAGATLPGGKPLTFQWLPVDGGTHRLSIVADDAGAALKALGIFDNCVGGRLTIAGSASDSDPRRAIKGHAEVTEYRLVRQSALLRLFSMSMLTGLADAMTGEGFQMYRFTGDFTKTGGHIDVPMARTWGPSLGLTASGNFDFDANSIDMHGTVIPAYSLNSLIGQIPLIGFLLTGGSNNGLFAVVYSASGKLSEPTINADPLSALAPGFLRGVFGLNGPSGNTEQPGALPPGVTPPGRKD